MTNKKRIEKDSLGPVELPPHVLYGPQTQRALENFGTSDRRLPFPFIMALVQVKKAAAKANLACESISSEKSNAIISAGDKIISMISKKESLEAMFPVSVFQTGSGTSSNMNMNEVIAHLANRDSESQQMIIHPNDDVNHGQSSNDVIPTSVQLSVLTTIHEDLFPALDLATHQLGKLQKAYKGVIKTGRTHLMDAMPLSMGDEFGTWRYQIHEGRERLNDSLGRLAQIPLGGTAIGTGINRHQDFPLKVAHYLSEQTNLAVTPSSNFASRICSQDPTLEVHGQLKVLATTLMKIANDLRWMNSGPHCGLAEIRLKALQPGSSIMPGKINPVIPESIAMMCAEVLGNDTTLTIANQSGNFQLNVMLPLIADKTLASVKLLSDCLIALAEKALMGFSVNGEKMKRSLEQNPVLATALNTSLGYEKATEIAKLAHEEGLTVKEVAKRESDMSDEELNFLLDPERLARPFE